MKQYILAIALLNSLLLLSCGDGKQNTASVVGKQDTTTTPVEFGTTEKREREEIHYDGKTYLPRYSPYISWKYLQQFLDNFGGRTATFDTTYYEELTGDGKPDKIHIETKPLAKDYICFSHIYSNDSLVWADTLRVTDKQGASLFGDSTLYYELKPYSAFYLVHQKRLSIVKDYFNQDDLEWKTQFLFSMLDDKKDTTYWKEAIKTYKGSGIWKFGFMDSDLFIWDEHKKKFIMCYAP